MGKHEASRNGPGWGARHRDHLKWLCDRFLELGIGCGSIVAMERLWPVAPVHVTSALSVVFGAKMASSQRFVRFERWLPFLTISIGMAGGVLYSYFTRS
jgi:hypothetical protein